MTNPRAECGCKTVNATAALPPGKVIPAHIVYCPLHKAAPELLEQVREFHNILNATDRYSEKCDELTELISRAEGKR